LAEPLLLLCQSTGDILNTGRGTLAALAALFKHFLETLVQTVKDLRQAHRIESENKLTAVICLAFLTVATGNCGSLATIETKNRYISCE